MAAYRRVHDDSRHLQADCQEPGSAPNPTLGNRVWATFTFLAASHSESGCIDAPYDVNLVLVLLGDRGCDDLNGL